MRKRREQTHTRTHSATVRLNYIEMSKNEHYKNRLSELCMAFSFIYRLRFCDKFHWEMCALRNLSIERKKYLFRSVGRSFHSVTTVNKDSLISLSWCNINVYASCIRCLYVLSSVFSFFTLCVVPHPFLRVCAPIFSCLLLRAFNFQHIVRLFVNESM